MKKYFKKSSLSAAIIAAATIATDVSAAILEEVMVTATKRTESVQDIAISVSALSGEQLGALGLSDMQDVTQQIPALQINAFSPQLTIFNLRGISQNNFVDNLEAPIAVYQDEAYIASMNAISGQMFDIKRIEVLRGPQGTLFGRNATGGLIHYLSETADEEEINGYIEAKAGSYDRKSIEGAIGGAITDNVRARFAFRTEEADGYIKADKSIPPVDDRAIGGADGTAFRASFQADLSDTLQADLIIKYSEDDDVPTGGYVFLNCEFDANELCPQDNSGRAIITSGIVSGDEFKHQNDTRGFLDRETTNITLKFSKDMDNGMEFVSITNHMDMDKEYLEDGDAFPAPIVVFGQDAEVTQFSQEFRLSRTEDRLKWQVGAYYMDYQLDGDAFTQGAPNIGLSFQLAHPDVGLISAPAAGPGDDNPFDAHSRRITDMSVKNFSIFGQLDYDLADDLTLTAGIRWSDDSKELDWSAFFTSDQQTTPLLYAATTNIPGYGTDAVLNNFADDEIEYDDIAARLSLQKQFSDDTQGFISWNRGIKGGNWTLASAVSPSRFQHKEEVLNSFEVGIKSDLSDTVRVNATVYYYDYEDYQTFVAVPPGSDSPNPQVGNSDATAQGAEIELFWTPTNNLDVLLGFAFSDSEVEEVEAGNQPILDAEFPNAPSTSVNYLVRYAFPFDSSELAAQIDGVYYGDQYLELTNGPGTEQEAYNISNASLTYSMDNGFSVSVWGKNIFDETYKAYSLDLGGLGATAYYAPPRTSGVTVRMEF